MTGAIDDTFLPDYSSFGLHAELLARTADELCQQDDEWGDQTHPFISDPTSISIGPGPEEIRAHFEQHSLDEKFSNGIRVANDLLDWRGILLEEVYEALGEADPGLVIEELVQVAAVALQAAGSIERHGLSGRA